MKPKIRLLYTKHDWNAFIEYGAICFRQCKLRPRVGFCCCLNRSRQVGGRHPKGSGGSKMNRGFPVCAALPYQFYGCEAPSLTVYGKYTRSTSYEPSDFRPP